MLKLPLEIGPQGRMLSLTPGGPADIGQSVGLLVATRPGERRTVPDYGLEDATFSYVGLREEQIRDAVDEWEPRAEITDFDELTDISTQDVTLWTRPRDDDEEVD